ncbi:MAG TPA: ABC transporter permease [Candidatus Acidoferrales bacterium]|nr:ABC transporter permease [Candidatus Acidoferrales bacterium]
MYLRIVTESFTRTPRRKILTAAALAMGMAVATATLTAALDVGDNLEREFRSLGANLIVTPKADTLPLQVGGVDYRPVDAGAYLPESELPEMKKIFWRNNIVGFAPFLDVPVQLELGAAASSSPAIPVTLIGTWVRHTLKIDSSETFQTGVLSTNPWWQVEAGGRWFNDQSSNGESSECVVGTNFAQRAHLHVGETIRVGADQQTASLGVTGIVDTGGPEDDAILAPLTVAQRLAGKPGQFRRMMVSAITKPEDAFAKRDPRTMKGAEFDRWYCSAYVSSIAYQIEGALPGVEARPVRHVAEGEGQILSRISALLWVVTLAALIGAALAVAATAATTVLERQREIGLMKALGASNGLVATFFMSEQVLLAIVGGGLGYAGGIFLARWLSLEVFGIAAPARLILLPVAVALAILVVLTGSVVPLRRAARFDPAPILRGE